MDELRAQTGYGRATIGETARLLAERGSVQVRPGRGGGLFVAETSPTVRLRQTLLTVPHDATTVVHAIAVRDALEELIALDAAIYRTEDDVKDLERHLDELRQAGTDLESFLRANWALHERIATITPNDLARAMYVGVLRCVAEMTVRADRDDPSSGGAYLINRLQVHEDLVAAIVAGDARSVKKTIAAHRDDDQGRRRRKAPTSR